MQQSQQRVYGFIGAGSMAEALLQGILKKQLARADQIWLTNRSNRQRLEMLRERWRVCVTEEHREVCRNADVLILAMKPIDFETAANVIREHVRPGTLVISVAAGIPTQRIEKLLGETASVVRAMPNTSSSVLAGATAICGGRNVQEDDMVVAEQLFTAVGCVVRVDEKLLDAVTGVSGSGPAYVYLMIESMIAAAVQLGLESGIARQLVVQTVLGAAKMVEETGIDPAELRRRVTSPGGTTMAALQVLEEAGFQSAMMRAIQRAAERSRELAGDGH